MMKKLHAKAAAPLLATALVLGLLSGCPNLFDRRSHSNQAAPGEGQVSISLAAAEENAASAEARTALPALASFYFTLDFTMPGKTPVSRDLDQAASISVVLESGDWTLEVRGYSDSARTGMVLQGSAPVSVASGATNAVTVYLKVPEGPMTGAGKIVYALQFPPAVNTGTMSISNHPSGAIFKTIDLLDAAEGNVYAASAASASATLDSVPAGYYRVLVKLFNGADGTQAGYVTLVHVYHNAETRVTKTFEPGNFSTYAMVDELDLAGLVGAPVKDAAPVDTPIDAAQYWGTIAWRQSDGNTPVSGLFAASGVYKAVVSITAKEGFTFDGVGPDAFSYAGLDPAAVTNPAGTGAGLTVTITFPATAASGLRYAKAGAAGLGTGASWEHASGDLQKMLDQARADKLADSGVTAIVRVAAGSYKPLYKPGTDGASILPPPGELRDRTFILRPGVEIRGGYPAGATNATGDSERNWAAHVTILSGDIDNNDTITVNGNNAYHVVLGVDIAGDGATILNGLTIRGGKADGSGNITVVTDSGSRLIERGWGAGLCNVFSSPVLTNVTIAGNSAVNGGGIYNNTSMPVLTNVTIAGNAATNGGGVYNTSSTPVLTNVTIAGNAASGGGGVFNSSPGDSPKIRNSIIWGNSSGIAGGAPEVYRSIVQGGSTGMDNLNIDPRFAAPQNALAAPTILGNYGLQSTSPAINMGDDEYYGAGETPDLSSIATDIDGVPRIAGAYVDLGAYEEQGGLTPDCLRYVREGGTGGGSSWADGSGDLQAMLDQAGRAKQRGAAQAIVRVAAGTYRPRYAPGPEGESLAETDAAFAANNLTVRDKTFILRPGVEIRGGYIAAGETISETLRKARFNAAGEPLSEAHRAILSGDIDDTADGGNARDGFTGMDGNAHHVVLGVDIPHDGTTILDGLTVKGGNGDISGEYITVKSKMISRGRGGIHLFGSSPVLTNMTITGNSALFGGGIANETSSPVLTNVTIAGNSTFYDGGGIFNHTSSSMVLTNVIITDNSAFHDGGGIYNYSSSSAVLTNVTIAGNTATSGGGGIYYGYSSSVILTNVTIAGNTSENNGGGIYTFGSSSVLTNVTIAGNSAGINGGGIYNYSGTPKIRNSIIWGNGSGIFVDSGTPEVYHSIVQGGWAGTDNMDIDPVFAAPQATSNAPTSEGDYRLGNTSPAINMGDNDYYPDTWAKWETQISATVITQAVYETYVLPALAKDAGGMDRFKDAYTADSSTNIDLGACEEQGGVTPDALRYVREGSTGGGGSWADGSGDLQAMVDQAGRAKRRGAARAIVRVAAGTYKPLYAPGPEGQSLAGTDAAFAANSRTPRDKTFFLRPGVEIRGGYSAAGETLDEQDRKARFNAAGEPLNETYRAVLSGDIDNIVDVGNAQDGFTGMDGNAYHVVIGVGIPNDGKTMLDGFTIKGGNATGSGNITVNGISVPRNYGGGIYNDDSSPVLTNVTIVGNSAGAGGGGIYNDQYSSPVLTNVTIAGNSADGGRGGGIYNDLASSPVLTNVTIAGNSADGGRGGGIYNDQYSSPMLTNVTIAGNSANYGGGIYDSGDGMPVLTNVTITGNSASDVGGGIYYLIVPSSPDIRNSIIWGNSPDGINVQSGTPEVYNSIVQGGWAGEGSGNLDIDPEFAGPGNHRLGANSPAINMGNNDYYPDTWGKWYSQISYYEITEAIYNAYILPALAKDLGGEDRIKPLGGTIDMGAYEEPGGMGPGISTITLTITDQGNDAFSQETFTISKAASQSQTVTVGGTGFTEPRWYVDGIKKAEGTSITIDAAMYMTGKHSLGLWVTKNGKPWSKELDFTVAD